MRNDRKQSIPDDDDDASFWRDIRHDQKDRRDGRLKSRRQEFQTLVNLGYAVRECSPFHFRIENCLNIWPSYNRFHDQRTDKRGRIHGSIVDFVRARLQPTRAANG